MRYFPIIIIASLLFSCTIKNNIRYEKRIIIAKTKDLECGSTVYRLAYNDGSTHNVDFGLYSKYNIGDTLTIGMAYDGCIKSDDEYIKSDK